MLLYLLWEINLKIRLLAVAFQASVLTEMGLASQTESIQR